MILNNKAFALTELLVTFGIIAVLTLLGVKFYNEHKESNQLKIAQTEAIEVLRLAQMAKQTDGWYHQFLFQMGYTPKGKITSVVGTGASNTSPCCSRYPALGHSSCTKTIGSVQSYQISGGQTCGLGFICTSGCQLGSCPSGTCTCQGERAVESYSYYNCENDALNKATYNLKICNASNYNNRCDTTKAPSVTTFPTFSKCPPSPSSWCNCNQFMVGVKSNLFKQELTLNNKNLLCVKK